MSTEPGIGQLLITRLARHEVDEVDDNAGNHQHLHIELVPVGGSVNRNLSERVDTMRAA